MSAFTLPPAPAGPSLSLIDPANLGVPSGARPVVPGAAARLLYLPQVAVVLLICLVGLAFNLDGWSDISSLQSAGVPAAARVVDIDSHRLSRTSRLFFITFEFEAAGLDGRTQTVRATDMFTGRRGEHGFVLGQEVAVRYLPADPATARFADTAPPTGWLAIFFIAASLALCVLLYFAKWAWDDATLRRRGRLLAGTLVADRPSLWPRTRRLSYRFTAPDGRELAGQVGADAGRLRRAGAMQPGATVGVLFVDDGLHTLL